MVVVGEVVVVVSGEIFVLLLAPGCVVAFVEVAGLDGEGGDAYAGEREVVGAVVAAGGRPRVGDDGEGETPGRRLDGGEEGGALGSVDVDLKGDPDGEDHVVVDVESDLARGDRWVLAEVLAAEETLFLRGDGGEDGGMRQLNAGLGRELGPGTSHFEQHSAAGGVVWGAVVDVGAGHSGDKADGVGVGGGEDGLSFTRW